MTTDPKECSENAKQCVALATQATDPVVQRRLLEGPWVDAACFRFGQNGLEVGNIKDKVGRAKRQAHGLSLEGLLYPEDLLMRRAAWARSRRGEPSFGTFKHCTGSPRMYG